VQIFLQFVSLLCTRQYTIPHVQAVKLCSSHGCASIMEGMRLKMYPYCEISYFSIDSYVLSGEV
jgi:hypothetical protein